MSALVSYPPHRSVTVVSAFGCTEEVAGWLLEMAGFISFPIVLVRDSISVSWFFGERGMLTSSLASQQRLQLHLQDYLWSPPSAFVVLLLCGFDWMDKREEVDILIPTVQLSIGKRTYGSTESCVMRVVTSQIIRTFGVVPRSVDRSRVTVKNCFLFIFSYRMSFPVSFETWWFLPNWKTFWT